MQPVGVWESQQRAFASEAAEEPRKPIPETKVCVRCKVERPSSEFRGSGKSRDGLQHFCIPCKVIEAQTQGVNGPSMHPTVSHQCCPRCMHVKEAAAFYKVALRTSGLSSWCKECSNEASAKSRERLLGLPADRGEAVKEKVCTRCQKSKGAQDFHRDVLMVDGLCIYCRACKQELKDFSRQRVPDPPETSDSMVCSVCGKEAPPSGFYQRQDNATGYYSYCKECHLRYTRKTREAAKKGRAKVGRAAPVSL
ncbi:hypothetical protein COCSUDRAFT_44662 [Coccomyxa subellipsoidea C-169]|uniref:Stc1 domain-containing protein n=1 Tax=Coccomyxa subellipsoidea (strain C-169) TaxID=574566 RepID=I0YLN5_COCSC|nr:hypothetical protein COCSUDRAFT_44662 [Coccomyxa subellipsoidea C-169]EIE19304.1 hypothetical protein COCSUDRAFT_44662 [Coccomyxa subellipsoidea C-169]|eukprot:XP_005643848.1 hypothetical protein COCSUDRAFT_44662 [Coccomyxa subellipsoidea C-169]